MPPEFFGVSRKEPPRVAVATGKVLDEDKTKKTKAEPCFLGNPSYGFKSLRVIDDVVMPDLIRHPSPRVCAEKDSYARYRERWIPDQVRHDDVYQWVKPVARVR